MKACNILKSSDEEFAAFGQTMALLVYQALTARDDPFGLESDIKYPKESSLSNEAHIVEKLTIAKGFMSKNGMTIEQMFFCPTDGDRESKFRGLYPDVQLSFKCKDKEGESWLFYLLFSVKK